MKPIVAGALVLGLGGCAAPDVGGFRAMAFGARGFEDRVWIADDPDAAGGAVTVFLSDGGKLTASCDGPYRLSAWRRVDEAELAWETDAGTVRAELALVGPRDLALVVDPDGVATTLTYRLGVATLGCPPA
jgi:hypothetical protein